MGRFTNWEGTISGLPPTHSINYEASYLLRVDVTKENL